MAVGWILDLIWWGIGYAVARLVVPFASFGKVQVGTALDSNGFGWRGWRRIEGGRFEIEATFAALIGLVICCAGLAAVLYLIH
ncbi:hypothetical protein [Bradyrhizobium symbiodeficiens]|uniref:Uncharacterized protein n=1 Tax=Bradyrhizobium symbiodeficiens TaxID=1404367 RepID=A0A6G9A7V5_9BRAD|nr:hypothetical protein [Bradyrhizobium symbiodeficiens]QIP08518.1 hypothetical protein HAV00_20650 [Bradyrhizobium symbiodeficiens]